MELMHLVVVLVVVGVLLWALNHLFSAYIQPPYLDLVNKIVLVLVVLYVLFWLLGFFGFFAAPAPWQGPHRRW